MSLDKLVSTLIENARREEQRNKAKMLPHFTVEKSARSLIEPSKKLAEHHRKREKFYTGEMETAERNLREKGVSVEAYDPNQGFALATKSITSGGMTDTSQYFQPKIDQTLLDAVKRAKAKMLEHRDKAERYEKLMRAFSIAPVDSKLELTVEDIHFFQLEGEQR